MNRRHYQKTAGILTLFLLMLASYQNCAPKSLHTTGTIENPSVSGTPVPTNPTPVPTYCTIPGGGMILSGQSVVMYKQSSAGCGQTCESAVVSCNGTTLSNTTFPHLTCTQRLCATWDLRESSNLPIMTFTGGDLTVRKDDGTAATRCSAYASGYSATGKYYFEVTVVNILGGTGNRIGIASRAGRNANDAPIANVHYSYGNNGTYYSTVNSISASTPSWGAGFVKDDVIGVLVNHDARYIEFYRNGVRHGTRAIIEPGIEYAPFYHGARDSNGVFRANFGATAFRHPPPAGYLKYEIPVF